MARRKVRALIVEPGKAPYEQQVEDIPGTWEKIVGGNIENGALPGMRCEFYCNSTGKLNRLPPNRSLDFGKWKDVIFGPFVIFGGIEKERPVSLTDEQADYCKQRFAEPEVFDTADQDDEQEQLLRLIEWIEANRAESEE